MTLLCGIKSAVWLLLLCAFGWTMWIVGHFQGRAAMRKRLKRTLNRAGSRFGEDI